MSEDLRIKVTYDIDDSKLQQSLKNVEKSTNSAVNGGSGGSGGGPAQSRLQNEVKNAQKYSDHLKQLQEAQNKLFSMPGAERQLAKVSQEMAGIYGRYKSLATDSGAYLQNLAKQVELQKEAAKYNKLATVAEGSYSAHSDRQFAMLQQIAGAAPGGNIISRFMGGARSSAMAAELAGGGGGGALAGGAMAAAAGAAALAVGALVSQLGAMGSRAQELAQSASSATSSLGQLRSQIEQTGIRKDMNAVSGGVTVAGFNQWKEQTQDSILGGFWDAFTGKSPQAKQKDINAAIAGGLGGDDKESWRRTLERGKDLQIDLARQKQSLDIQQFRQNRDFALEEKSWNIDVANQKFDLQKQAQRNEQDYTIQKKMFDENQAGVMAAKQFDLQQKYATQAYQIQKQRDQENFSIQQSYKAQDYAISQSRAKTQFAITQSDRSYDFGVSQSRNQTEFNINRSRQREDYGTNLMKMALSGADGTSYLFAAIDFNKQQKRELEDFNRQKSYATQDYTLAQGRDIRNFGLSQAYAKQDYQLGAARDTQQFGISQARNAQDFSISRQQAQEQRNLQIEDMLYQRKYEGISLELQHNRNLEDSSIALQRLNVAVGLQAERFGNQASDINIDQALQNRDFNIQAYRTMRDYGYQQQDFAGQVRKTDPLAAYGQSLTDPAFRDALARNAAATGQRPLADQVNDARSGFDWGDAIGRAAAFSLGFGNPASFASQPGRLNGLGGAPNITFSPQTNITMPTVPGVSQQDLDYWNNQVNQAIGQAINGVYDNMRRMYGG